MEFYFVIEERFEFRLHFQFANDWLEALTIETIFLKDQRKKTFHLEIAKNVRYRCS